MMRNLAFLHFWILAFAGIDTIPRLTKKLENVSPFRGTSSYPMTGFTVIEKAGILI